MGELVEKQRPKEKQARENAYTPLLCGIPGRVLLGELHRKRVRDGGKDDDPRRMKIDGYSKNPADAHSGACRHVEWVCEQMPLSLGNSERGPRSFSFQACTRACYLSPGSFAVTTTIAPFPPLANCAGETRVWPATACAAPHRVSTLPPK